MDKEYPLIQKSTMKTITFLFCLFISLLGNTQKRNPQNKAIYLEDINWIKAKELLTPEAIVVIPLGAGSKEHGPHLPLGTDFIQANGYTNKLALARKVIITPVINYGLYPAFLKYAGSTSVNFSTSTEMILQIVRYLSAYGPRRFYIINTGVSTVPSLAEASKVLAEEGILLYFSRYDRPNFAKAEDALRTKQFGGHGDEIETSNMLYLRQDLVDMTKAVNDSSIKNNTGVMTPIPLEGGVLNTSGLNGYAKLATKEKGNLSVSGYSAEVIKEIDSIATCALPKEKSRAIEYAAYEGNYQSASGKKLAINQKNNRLYYIWDGRDLRNFYALYKDTEDYFTSVPMNLLFIKNENGEVTKAWCRYRGESFWATRIKE